MEEGLDWDRAHELALRTHPKHENYHPDLIGEMRTSFSSTTRRHWGYPLKVIEDGYDRAYITTRADFSTYSSVTEFQWVGPSFGESSVPRSGTVEIYRRYSGGAQRALLGGEKKSMTNGPLSLTVPSSGPIASVEPIVCHGLSGTPFLVGLLEEDVQPVFAGLLHWPTTAGELRLTSAAYHEEGSSYFALLIAAQVLSVVLHSKSADLSEAEEDTIRLLLRSSARV